MKVKVNKDACIGCGACISIDPEHFDFDGNYSHVISEENLDSQALQNAVESCPTGAIVKEECDGCGNCQCSKEGEN